MTRGRGSHNIVATVPQRLQLFSVIAAVVAVVFVVLVVVVVVFCLAKDMARVLVCVCVVCVCGVCVFLFHHFVG